MNRKRRIMAVLGNLFAFESAARQQSFTLAARELGMTQSAISQKVRALEQELGQALFKREGRGIVLTKAGRGLQRETGFAFHTLDKAVAGFERARTAPVTLSVSTAFAAWWMAPRLGRFQADCPDIDLRLQTTDRDVDIVAEELSLGVRVCTGEVNGCECSLLCDEEIFPVCSPAWLAEHGRPETPADLLAHRLIHLEEPYRPTPNWRDWLRACGVHRQDDLPGLRINDYALVLQAALQGQGFALGWRHLVQPLLDQGLLIKPLTHSLATGMGFYVIQPALRRHGDPADRVRRWMLGACRT